VYAAAAVFSVWFSESAAARHVAFFVENRKYFLALSTAFFALAVLAGACVGRDGRVTMPLFLYVLIVGFAVCRLFEVVFAGGSAFDWFH